MRILSLENYAVSMNDIPDEVSNPEANVEDLRYNVLDYSDTKNIDYVFIPMLFLESFNAPAVNLSIGPYNIQMPMDWSVLIADKNSGEVEVIELKKINDRTFKIFSLNPVTGFMPEFYDISITNVFPDVKWYFPKLKYGHILTVPLTSGKNPPCCFFLKDANKIPESLDITQMV